jgi:hypothetical protein
LKNDRLTGLKSILLLINKLFIPLTLRTRTFLTVA